MPSCGKGSLIVKSYVSTFCNHAHRLRDGSPISHECYVLDRKKLKAEAEGEPIEGSMIALPSRVVRGRACRAERQNVAR